ncbi:MAG: hypothetical protein HRU19_00555 [Pseudobacteriovorax sp.]|nr:hypothetical protein [Pseudobacteriovorax sp.]
MRILMLLGMLSFFVMSCGESAQQTGRNASAPAPKTNSTNSEVDLGTPGTTTESVTSDSSSKKESNIKEDYNYDFEDVVDGEACVTKQSFDSLESYCNGLKDDGLNDSCAVENRRILYETDCETHFGPFSE